MPEERSQTCIINLFQVLPFPETENKGQMSVWNWEAKQKRVACWHRSTYIQNKRCNSATVFVNAVLAWVHNINSQVVQVRSVKGRSDLSVFNSDINGVVKFYQMCKNYRYNQNLKVVFWDCHKAAEKDICCWYPPCSDWALLFKYETSVSTVGEKTDNHCQEAQLTKYYLIQTFDQFHRPEWYAANWIQKKDQL